MSQFYELKIVYVIINQKHQVTLNYHGDGQEHKNQNNFWHFNYTQNWKPNLNRLESRAIRSSYRDLMLST